MSTSWFYPWLRDVFGSKLCQTASPLIFPLEKSQIAGSIGFLLGRWIWIEEIQLWCPSCARLDIESIRLVNDVKRFDWSANTNHSPVSTPATFLCLEKAQNLSRISCRLRAIRSKGSWKKSNVAPSRAAASCSDMPWICMPARPEHQNPSGV